MLILFFFIFLNVLAAEDLIPTSQCPDNPTFCMLDLLKTWEELRLPETNATNILLPVLYYSKSSLITLCESYSNVEEKCGLGRCHVDNPVANFVTRHFSFVCQKDAATKYFENQQCISLTLVVSKCTTSIKEEPKMGGELFCPNVDKFVTCIEEPLRTSCGNEAYALVMKAIERYGCPSKIEVARVNEFLSVGVDASTLLISENLENTTAKVTTDGSKPEVNMLVKTSLNVDDKNTTLGVSKEEEVIATTESTKEKKLKSGEVTSHVLESTTTVEFLENKISEKSNEIVEGSGENLTPETTTVTLETVQTRRPKRKQFNAENMTDCYTSIIGDFGRFLHSSPYSSFVRFPLFGIKPMELEVLCAKFAVATECVNSFCVGNCRLPAIKSFVDSQLKEACAMKDLPDFALEFTCMQSVFKDNTECISFLNSTNPNRCDGHPQFRNCIIERLLGDCSDETVRLMDRLENGFGCKLLVEQEIDEGSDGSGESLEGSGSGDVPEGSRDKKKWENTPGNLTDETLLTEDLEVKPKICEGIVKTTALSCLAPLLRLWTGIKENRKDTEVVFPIFEFSKIELLELCDAFANYRSCIKYTVTTVCRSEPVINFAEEHFGQVCTSQQIEASMRTHECINAIDSRSMGICQKFSRGETLPGKRKCPKVRRYTSCLRKLVSSSCGHLMLAQFDMIVNRFGC
ncbi:DUF19 domain-containing protein [Caenorhabditis elegans]|uniref:DUF19 domain-containing protein n=2 Tax=Caenorhabditis elegans TaxID=6239 RepID=C6KRL8_CAEEL|nr:DUF19 domain-containing protein [Caenorhabditis elegans]CAZ39163.2 DUF19 domain-containing protein [Caenorhabditis elegans]|eukprot:NP_001256529.1 Uncharacterized protein CELE_F53F4.4 [Caenorhabditis elegans]